MRQRLPVVRFATVLVVVAGVGLFSMNRAPVSTSDLRHQFGGVWLGPAQPCDVSDATCARQLELARARLVEQVGAGDVASVARFGPPAVDEQGRLIVYGVGWSGFAFTLADGRQVVVGFICPGDGVDFCTTPFVERTSVPLRVGPVGRSKRL